MLVLRNHHQTALSSKPRLKFNEETPGVIDHLPPTSHTKASSAALDFFSSSFLEQIPCEAVAAPAVSYTTLTGPCHWADRAIYQLFI